VIRISECTETNIPNLEEETGNDWTETAFCFFAFNDDGGFEFNCSNTQAEKSSDDSSNYNCVKDPCSYK